MQRKIKFSKMAWNDKIFVTSVTLILIILFVVMLYPLVFVLSASISDPKLVSAGEVILLPKGLNFDGYLRAFEYESLWTGYANTLFYTVVGTTCNLLVTIPCAYALSRRQLKGRGVIMAMFMVTMYFSGGTIPNYLNVVDLGLLNTRAILLISGLVNVSNLIVTRSFFASVPEELIEAASIDGANDGQCFVQVVLPVSKAVIGVMALYYAVAHWNNYFTAMIYLEDSSKYPLQLVLRRILVQAQTAAQLLEGSSLNALKEAMAAAEIANSLKYCVIILSTLPMLILYPFIQKYFEKGVMIGSVKG